MKNIYLIILCLFILFLASPSSYAYGIRVQRDYRFTTQQDRNKRIEVYHDYLTKAGFFDENNAKHILNFKKYEKDRNYKDNLKYIKFDTPLPQTGYTVKGNYYKMADKILENYSIIYDNDPDTEYIYNTQGRLYQVVIYTGDTNVRPHYKAVYAFNGYLQKVHFFAVDGYEYIFLPDGDLQGVVVDGKLYNTAGRPLKIWLK